MLTACQRSGNPLAPSRGGNVLSRRAHRHAEFRCRRAMPAMMDGWTPAPASSATCMPELAGPWSGRAGRGRPWAARAAVIDAYSAVSYTRGATSCNIGVRRWRESLHMTAAQLNTRPRRRPGPAMRAVAAGAGVSVATVSRVLSNHPAIPEATRRLVLAECQKLGYALPARRTRAHRIGLVTSIGADEYIAKLLYGAAATVHDHGGALDLLVLGVPWCESPVSCPVRLPDHGLEGALLVLPLRVQRRCSSACAGRAVRSWSCTRAFRSPRASRK